MIKASGKTRVVLIIVSVALIAAGIWFVISYRQNNLAHKGRPNPDYQNNLKTLNLKGRVKSLKEVNYVQQAPAEDLIKPFSSENVMFDENGNVIKHVYAGKDNGIISDVRYVYDDAANYTSMIFYQGGAPFLTTTFVFDENGRLLEGDDEVKGMVKHWVVDYRDTVDGYIRERRQVEPAEAAPGDYKKTFDTLKHEVHIVEPFFLSRSYERFDKRGNTIDRIKYVNGDAGNAPADRYTAAYNSNDQVVREEYSVDKNVEIYYAYDTNGNIIECTYIDQGNVSPKSYRAVYAFDSVGNWIHRVLLYLDGTPKSSIDRVIEYY